MGIKGKRMPDGHPSTFYKNKISNKNSPIVMAQIALRSMFGTET